MNDRDAYRREMMERLDKQAVPSSNLVALLRRNVGGSGDYKTEVRASLLDEAANEIERLTKLAVSVTPTEADELIRWHTMCANVSHQTDDFAGARWHREKLTQWQAWKGGKRSAVETTAERWKERAVEAEGILSHNMALANATTRRAMNERNDIIRKLRERHSAIEIADMVGLTRQRVHQILNESPDEGAVEASETPPVHTYTCTSCFTDAGQPHRPGCRNIEIDARQVKTGAEHG